MQSLISRSLILTLSFIFSFLATSLQAQDESEEPQSPQINVMIGNIQGKPGTEVSLPVSLEIEGKKPNELEISLKAERWILSDINISQQQEAKDLRIGYRIEAQSESIIFQVPSEAITLNQTIELGKIEFQLPGSTIMRPRKSAFKVSADDSNLQAFRLNTDGGKIAIPLIQDPVVLFSFLAAVVAGIYWLSGFAALEKFFTYFPPLIWMYFVPMVATTLGLIPDSSSLYSPFMSRIILPAILVLLLIPSDIRGIVKLGGKAVIVMIFATTGIVAGATISTWLFTMIAPDALPEDTWKGVGALAGSWIGGSPNMTAVIESVKTPPYLVGPLIIVDTVLAYSWLGILIALSSYQQKIDKKHKADTSVIEEISSRLKEEHEENAKCPSISDIAMMVAAAFVVSQICLALGGPLFSRIDGTEFGNKVLSPIISTYGWGILLITAAGLFLSTTPLRKLDHSGASSIGYVGLYILLTTYGARANLNAIFDIPIFFALGFVWLIIHIAFLYIGIRVVKAPMFLGATSSMANIGGTASAPVVAAAYNQSMAPVGLLMAILGGAVGTPVAFFVAYLCKQITGA